MVSNPGYYSQMATGGSLTQIEDGVDNPHTGLIKALSLGVAGNYVISGFDATSVTQTTATIADGVVLVDGKRETVTGGGITLSTSETVGYHLLVARTIPSTALTLINPTAPDKVPAFNAGDVPIAVLAHTGSNPMRIQYFGTGKTKNSLSLAYSNSGTYTEMSKITAANGGTTVEVATAGGDFTIDNTDADKKIIMRLGSDDANTDFEVRNNSDAVKFGVDGAGTTTIAGTVNLGSVVNAGTDTDKFLVLDSGGNVDFRTGTEVRSDIGAGTLSAESDTLDSVTGRGATTTNNITVGNATLANLNAGGTVTLEKNKAPFGAATLAAPVDDAAIFYIDEASGAATLPNPNNHIDQVIFIKNLNATTLNITPTVGTIDNALVNHDKRVTVANTIKLLQGESVVLQALADGGVSGGNPTTVVQGWYILSTDVDTDTGIANVVEDTTPQLGGNLDVNGNSIVSTSGADINITPNGTGQVNLGNFQFDVDQSVGSGQDNYVLTYDHANTQISLEPASGGMSNVVEDITPQLGGDLDTNSKDITGDFALTGAVQMKKSVVATGNVSPLASATDSGKYFYRANAETANFTLPADTYVGEQYVLMNNSGSSITIASTGGDTIVGSTSVPHESAVTIIAVAANTWFVVG